jgi:hypothetical protein
MEYLHSPDNVPWGTTKVPWVIKSYNTKMPPCMVLSGKRVNGTGQLLVPP